MAGVALLRSSWHLRRFLHLGRSARCHCLLRCRCGSFAIPALTCLQSNVGEQQRPVVKIVTYDKADGCDKPVEP